MTEEEHKKKWCPLARPSEMSALRYISPVLPQHTLCLGSGCAMWRSLGEPIERTTGYSMGFVPRGEGWRCTLSETGREGFVIKSVWERDVPPQGYCGLAGKP